MGRLSTTECTYLPTSTTVASTSRTHSSQPSKLQPWHGKRGRRQHQRRWQTTSGTLADGSTPPPAGKTEHPTHLAHSSTQHPPPPHTAEASEELGVFCKRPPGRPQ